jgi:hypothetical protein
MGGGIEMGGVIIINLSVLTTACNKASN